MGIRLSAGLVAPEASKKGVVQEGEAPARRILIVGLEDIDPGVVYIPPFLDRLRYKMDLGEMLLYNL